MTLQHTWIKASFETSMHVVGHMFKVTLYKKLLCMVSRYALNEIDVEYERVAYTGKNPSWCGCVMRCTHSLPCACELFKYVVRSIPMETIHIFWQRLSFSDQGLSETQVTIAEEMKTIFFMVKYIWSQSCEKLFTLIWTPCVLLKKKWWPRVLQKNRLPNNKSQQNAIRLIGNMLMCYTLCKIVIRQWNVVHHHLRTQYRDGIF